MQMGNVAFDIIMETNCKECGKTLQDVEEITVRTDVSGPIDVSGGWVQRHVLPGQTVTLTFKGGTQTIYQYASASM